MKRIVRLSMQALAYLVFAAPIAYFASMPSYRYAEADLTSIKLSIVHTTERVKPCVPLTQEQIAALAANMRRAESCERERLPLYVELDVDGRTVIKSTSLPSGLWRDGHASVYQRVDVPGGKHNIAVRIRDSARSAGWDYEQSTTADLQAGRYFTVTFRSETGEFVFR
jgi:hypothetical protein